MKNKTMIIGFLFLIASYGLIVSSTEFANDIGQYGYSNLWNASGQDLQVDNIRVAGHLEVSGTLNISDNLIIGDGGTFNANSTCTFLTSPDASTVIEVCDVEQ